MIMLVLMISQSLMNAAPREEPTMTSSVDSMKDIIGVPGAVE